MKRHEGERRKKKRKQREAKNRDEEGGPGGDHVWWGGKKGVVLGWVGLGWMNSVKEVGWKKKNYLIKNIEIWFVNLIMKILKIVYFQIC